jgi:hypothetical protein
MSFLLYNATHCQSSPIPHKSSSWILICNLTLWPIKAKLLTCRNKYSVLQKRELTWTYVDRRHSSRESPHVKSTNIPALSLVFFLFNQFMLENLLEGFPFGVFKITAHENVKLKSLWCKLCSYAACFDRRIFFSISNNSSWFIHILSWLLCCWSWSRR